MSQGTLALFDEFAESIGDGAKAIVSALNQPNTLMAEKLKAAYKKEKEISSKGVDLDEASNEEIFLMMCVIACA